MGEEVEPRRPKAIHVVGNDGDAWICYDFGLGIKEVVAPYPVHVLLTGREKPSSKSVEKMLDNGEAAV